MARPQDPEPVDSDVFDMLRTRYLDKKRLERQWASRYGSTHEAVLRLRAEADELHAAIRAELKRVAEAYRTEVDIIQRESLK